jgi:hypothetical protein
LISIKSREIVPKDPGATNAEFTRQPRRAGTDACAHARTMIAARWKNDTSAGHHA